MASEEILHFRDWRLSQRHRDWYGLNCPMIDIDFLVCEYDCAAPVAIVEYKHACRQIERLRETAGIKTLRALGNFAGLPAWVAYYHVKSFTYQIMPLNQQAIDVFGAEDFIEMVEADYVHRLYKLRHRDLPDNILAHLNQTFGIIKKIDLLGPTVQKLGRKMVRPTVKKLCHPKHMTRK